MNVDAGLATAITGGFLVVGTSRGVRDVIDTQRGRAGSLADDPEPPGARDALPEERLADAYLSEDGSASWSRATRGPARRRWRRRQPGASRRRPPRWWSSTTASSLEDPLELDPGARRSITRGSSPPSRRSSLASPARCSRDSLGYLGIGDPGQAI